MGRLLGVVMRCTYALQPACSQPFMGWRPSCLTFLMHISKCLHAAFMMAVLGSCSTADFCVTKSGTGAGCLFMQAIAALADSMSQTVPGADDSALWSSSSAVTGAVLAVAHAQVCQLLLCG